MVLWGSKNSTIQNFHACVKCFRWKKWCDSHAVEMTGLQNHLHFIVLPVKRSYLSWTLIVWLAVSWHSWKGQRLCFGIVSDLSAFNKNGYLVNRLHSHSVSRGDCHCLLIQWATSFRLLQLYSLQALWLLC